MSHRSFGKSIPGGTDSGFILLTAAPFLEAARYCACASRRACIASAHAGTVSRFGACFSYRSRLRPRSRSISAR